MANGHYRTFDEFGWNASQSAPVQRANVQSALDSGEPLLRPVGETVLLDGPLVMTAPTTMIGQSTSIFNAADITQDILRIEADRAIVDGGQFFRNQYGAGKGIVVGPNGGTFCKWVRVRNTHTHINNSVGLHVKATGDLQVSQNNIAGYDSGVLWENILNSDAGDNKFFANDINANSTDGVGFRHRSGGGLYATLNKFGAGKNHVKYEWYYGSSGIAHWVNNGFETCTGISFDMDGTVPFVDMKIALNRFAVPSCAIVVRNFQSAPWLTDLDVSTNQIYAGAPSGSPCIDLGSVSVATLNANIIRGGGVAQCGIYVRPQATDIGVGCTNKIRGCVTPVINGGASTTIQPML